MVIKKTWVGVGEGGINMAIKDLEAFRNRFNEIKEGKEPMRTNRLVNLMNDLEQAYQIPATYSTAFQFNNPEVMRLYRDVSYAREI